MEADAVRRATALIREALLQAHSSLGQANEGEIVDLLGAASDLSRAVDGLRVTVAATIASRSEGLPRSEALCSRLGFRSTKALLAQAFGLQMTAAESLVSLAQATSPRDALSAGQLPPFRPALAVALLAGELSVDQAAAVHRVLPQPGCAESRPGLTTAAERSLVDSATGGRVSFDDRGRAAVVHQTRALNQPADPVGGDAGVGGAGAGAVTGGAGEGPGSALGLPQTQIPSLAPGAGAAGGGRPAGHPAYRDVDVWGGRRLEPHLLRVQAGAWKIAIDPDGVEPTTDEQVRRRAFTVRHAAGGGWSLNGYAPEAQGAALASFFEQNTGPTRRARGTQTGVESGEADERTPEQRGFDALHALVERDQRVAEEGSPGGTGATVVVSVTLEALDRFARWQEAGGSQAGQSCLADRVPGFWGGLGHGASASELLEPVSHREPIAHREPVAQEEPGAHREPVEDVTRADLDLQELDASFAWHSRSDDPLPVSEVATLLCTDARRLLVLDRSGTPVRMGRSQRPFTRAQRQALAARDRHCRAPGCLAPPSWCHTHHVIPWSFGGPTDLDHAILLCSFHHHEVHRERLVVVRADEVGVTGHRWAVIGQWHRRALGVAAVAAGTRGPSATRGSRSPAVVPPTTAIGAVPPAANTVSLTTEAMPTTGPKPSAVGATQTATSATLPPRNVTAPSEHNGAVAAACEATAPPVAAGDRPPGGGGAAHPVAASTAASGPPVQRGEHLACAARGAVVTVTLPATGTVPAPVEQGEEPSRVGPQPRVRRGCGSGGLPTSRSGGASVLHRMRSAVGGVDPDVGDHGGGRTRSATRRRGGVRGQASQAAVLGRLHEG